MALALACVALATVGCGASAWQDIRIATLSPDGKKLTVKLVFGAPDATGRPCERVTDTEVTETPSRVVIGVEVDASCRRSWPWEEAFTNMVGRAHLVQFPLKEPLGERTVVNNTSVEPVTIDR
ncbi:MAG TPA: hypothetical protein VFV66_37640 [Nonomuraea sp.]|nr:hypothetical protein [Nonomuraea sp.]